MPKEEKKYRPGKRGGISVPKEGKKSIAQVTDKVLLDETGGTMASILQHQQEQKEKILYQ